MSLRAYYNLFGYRVESDGVVIREAGNSPTNSDDVLPPWWASILPVHVIVDFARKAVLELAAERGEELEGEPRYDKEEEEAIARRHDWELPGRALTRGGYVRRRK